MAKIVLKPRDVRGEIRRCNGSCLIWSEFAEFPDGTVDGAWIDVPKTIAMALVDIAENKGTESPKPDLPMVIYKSDGDLFIGVGPDPEEMGDDGPEEEGEELEDEEEDEDEDEP